MLDRVIRLFNASGQDRVDFKPPLRVQLTPHSHVVFIEALMKIKENYLISVSTTEDAFNINVRAIDDKYLSSLLIRLTALYGKDVPEGQ